MGKASRPDGLRANHGKKDAYSSAFDAFLVIYDLNGNFQWVRTWGGAGADSPGFMALDGADNLYITGQFQHTVDFNPGSGIDNLPSENTALRV